MAPITYGFGWWLRRRAYVGESRWKLYRSFNGMTVFCILTIIGMQSVSTGLTSLGNSRIRLVSMGSTAFLVLILYALALAQFYFFAKLYAEWRRRSRSQPKWYDNMEPEPTLRGRGRQADRLIEDARRSLDPIVKLQLISSIKSLLPLDEKALIKLEEFCESERNIEVRTRGFQVYEQIEMSIARERGAKRYSEEVSDEDV